MSDPYSVLIDTCAMAKLSFYCELCDSVNKGYGTDPATIYSCLSRPLSQENIDVSPANAGFRFYNHLYNLVQQEKTVLYFSLFAKIELFDIFLDVSTDELLAAQGIPFRVRRKKPLRWQVKFNFNEKVIERYNKVLKCLDSIGMSITCPEEDPRSSYKLAFEINEALASHVFLDSFDSYLYSLGLFLMVDEILTDDKEFRIILTDFSTKSEWALQRESLKKEIINIAPDYQGLCIIEHEDGSVDYDLTKFIFPQMTGGF